MDHEDTEFPSPAISRRAVLGGAVAVAWSAPLVSVVRPAFAQNGTPLDEVEGDELDRDEVDDDDLRDDDRADDGVEEVTDVEGRQVVGRRVVTEVRDEVLARTGADAAVLAAVGGAALAGGGAALRRDHQRRKAEKAARAAADAEFPQVPPWDAERFPHAVELDAQRHVDPPEER